ncbi:MAG: TylF/MycF/NovP-related O-methyltransferase [Bacteroidota bacterium]
MKKSIARFVRPLLRSYGLDIVRFDQRRQGLPVDFSEEDATIVAAVQPYTMTGAERVYALVQAVRYVVVNNIPGAIVECGVWKGGSMMAVAMALVKLGVSDRDLYLYDTFEGMTAPGAIDVSHQGKKAAEMFEGTRIGDDSSDWCNASIEEVRETLLSTGYPAERLHFVKGKVEDTIPEVAPEAIAILRLDTDWYESTRHELQHLYPRISRGGALVLDDYGHWLGSRQATDEYIAQHNLPLLLNRIDYSGRIGLKL